MSRPTLVLLHGIGSDRSCWSAVRPLLEEDLDVLPLDLVGHGGRPLPYGLPPTPAAFALWAAEDLGAQGHDRVHVAGHSLGGWVALELARLGRTESVTAVSPGGLWAGRAPLSTQALLRLAHVAAVTGRPLARLASESAVARWLTLRLAVSHPERVSASEALAADAAMATADGFDDVLTAMIPLRLDATDIHVPVTVLFGASDAVLPPGRAQQRDRLPPQTRWLEVRDAGHVLPLERPGLVADAIVDTVRRAEVARTPSAVDLAGFGFSGLPESTRDERAEGWGEHPISDADRWSRERPPHWE